MALSYISSNCCSFMLLKVVLPSTLTEWSIVQSMHSVVLEFSTIISLQDSRAEKSAVFRESRGNRHIVQPSAAAPKNNRGGKNVPQKCRKCRHPQKGGCMCLCDDCGNPKKTCIPLGLCKKLKNPWKHAWSHVCRCLIISSAEQCSISCVPQFWFRVCHSALFLLFCQVCRMLSFCFSEVLFDQPVSVFGNVHIFLHSAMTKSKYLGMWELGSENIWLCCECIEIVEFTRRGVAGSRPGRSTLLAPNSNIPIGFFVISLFITQTCSNEVLQIPNASLAKPSCNRCRLVFTMWPNAVEL